MSSHVLVLRFVGPLQSWATRSRFADRRSELLPSKSGVIGLLSACLGLRVDDCSLIDVLADTHFGVRVDAPGVVVSDFQTATLLTGDTLPLSCRTFLADAVFVVFVEVPEMWVDRLREGVMRPIFTPFLGRKSCVPSSPLLVTVLDGVSIEDAAGLVDFEGGFGGSGVVPLIMDASGDCFDSVVNDVPINFGERSHRQRFVKRVMVNPPMPERLSSVDGGSWFSRFIGSLDPVISG